MPRTGGEGRRTTIVEESIRQFGRDGYNGASLERIAQAVGVRKQTLLYYFPTKDDLLEACLAAAGKRVAEEIASALEGPATPGERAERVIHAVYSLAEEWPEFPMFIREAGRLGPTAFERFGAFLEPLRVSATEFLQTGMDAGLIRKQDPALLLFTLYTAVIGSLTEASVLASFVGADDAPFVAEAARGRGGGAGPSRAPAARGLGAGLAGPLRDLIAKGAQHFDLDQVLRPAGSTLHRDQILDRGDRDRQAIDREHLRLAFEGVEPIHTRGRPEDVEVARVRREREVISRGQGLRVELERRVTVGAAKPGVELAERSRESFEVRRRALEADVGIVRDGRRPVQPRPEATDHDVAHLVSREGSERTERVERARGQADADRSSRSRFRPSRVATRIRCAGVSRSSARIEVRSIPTPGRRSMPSCSPHPASSRSRVSTRGTTVPRSIRAIAGCGIPVRVASARWVSPARRRASRRSPGCVHESMITKKVSTVRRSERSGDRAAVVPDSGTRFRYLEQGRARGAAERAP